LNKGLKDSDWSLVFNENFSETLWPSDWALGRQHEPKWLQNYFTYDVSHKKSAPPNQKHMLQVQSTRLADPFEPLNNSLAQSTEELWRW